MRFAKTRYTEDGCERQKTATVSETRHTPTHIKKINIMNTIKTKKGVAVVCNSIKREDIREPFFHEEKESYPGMELIDDDGVRRYVCGYDKEGDLVAAKTEGMPPAELIDDLEVEFYVPVRYFKHSCGGWGRVIGYHSESMGSIDFTPSIPMVIHVTVAGGQARAELVRLPFGESVVETGHEAELLAEFND